MTGAVALFAAFALTPSAVSAQATSPAAMEACLDAIPVSAFTRVPVHLLPTASDSTQRAILPSADILADMVARHVRAALRTADSPLPAGEPAIDWRDLGREIVVTVGRDGGFSWRVDDSGSLLRPGGQSPPDNDLLVQALAAARDSGERLFWPADATVDSLSFRLELSVPTPTRTGALKSTPLRVSIPIFSLAVPWISNVAVTKAARIRYPEVLRQMGMTGTIILRYVVNADGRADPATLSDLWNSPLPYPSGDMGRAYRSFIATVRRDLPTGRFQPALAGGCPVPQLVRQPFVFDIR